MISYETELEDRVRRLVEDVGPLATVSLLGFEESDRRKADAALAKLSAEQAWCFVDLRSAKPEEAKAAVGDRIQERTLVLATRHDRVSRPILNLVRALVDRSPRVELGDDVELERPKGQSLVLVLEGVSAHEGLPNDLKRIPYEEYLP
jgi:hypothetical protein